MHDTPDPQWDAHLHTMADHLVAILSTGLDEAARRVEKRLEYLEGLAEHYDYSALRGMVNARVAAKKEQAA